MAEAVQQFPYYDAVARDQEEARRARELRARRVMTGALRAEQGRQSAFGQVGQSAEALQEIQKKIKNIRNVVTLIGGLTSLTLIGIIWTIIQWNLQMIWKVFGLPGENYFGLSWWLVPVILLVDFILFILFIAVMLVAFFVSNPTQACSIAPDLTKLALGDGFIGTLGTLGAKVLCGIPALISHAVDTIKSAVQ